MSKSIDVLARDFAFQQVPHPNASDAPYTTTGDKWDDIYEAYKAGYKQRNDELIYLLVELEDYFEMRQDADYEGEETGMVPNKEMQFYGQLKEQIEKL